MPGTVAADGPTVSMSFANNFWGKEDAGVIPLLDRMHGAKVTGEELKSFYSNRAQIEEEYARKMLNLARKPLGSLETGTLRMSLDVVRGELESMGKQHQAIAAQMKSELDEPLAAFHGSLKERRKIVQGGVEKLLKTKNQQTATVNKSRDRFEQDCLKIKGYLAQGHMVMGQEERKNKAKLEKTQIQMSTNSNEYEAAVKVLEETTGRWNREWKAACDKFQDLEEERIDYFKSSLWTFANITSTVCVSDDASCEKVRLSLEDCEVEKDIMQFIKDSGTGQEIPDAPKYINFCRGDMDDNASMHESDDGNYSVAQFQRTMNPSFRSSSPQPSTLESHNDPESNLREEMGMPKQAGSVRADEGFDPRASQGSTGAPPPLTGSQISMGTNPYAEVPQVPHNPYPPEGMTQFTRLPAPSERSSNPSPTRSASRGSIDRSDYSAPTSMSSVDPTSGHVSPTKGYNGSNVSAVSSNADDKTVQKKKSGFFQSHSPFRRRSQKNKDPPAPASTSASVTPTARNTWAPANSRNAMSTNTSPTKPFGANNRSNSWQPQQSPDPEVDPRAEGYQLGIGNNVFDVASPNSRNTRLTPQKEDPLQMDPIAQALAELKGVTKQASIRQSADRHYGVSTPAPDGKSMPTGGVPTPFANNGQRNTPPPAYDQPMSRLGAPQPAHTSREMQRTTERYVNQGRDMYNGGGGPPRPSSGMAQRPDPRRSASPGPGRAASPRPYGNGDPRQQQHPQQQPPYRSASPNPYGGPGGPPGNRPRAMSNSPQKPNPNYGSYNSRSGGSPGYQAPPRAASPNPAYNRPSNGGSRPPSSRESEHPGNGSGMALQLAPSNQGRNPYGGLPSQQQQQQQQQYGQQGQQRAGRPQSQYYAPEEGSYGANSLGSRTRSQSVGAQRQFTKSGAPILHYSRALYMYQAAIPEELSFAKGDVLAVTRHQDDGWWEAEVVGNGKNNNSANGGPGLVPSNYLKNC